LIRDFNHFREVIMKRLVALAALLLASSAADAGDSYSFEVGGRTIRIEAPSGCDSPSCVSVSIPGIYESEPKHTKRTRAARDPQAKADVQKADRQIKADPKTDPPSRVEPPVVPAAKAESSQPPNGTPPMTTATSAPSSPPALAPASPRAGEPAPSQPAAAPAAGPVVAAAPASTPIQQQVPAAAASRPAASPLGTWQTEEREGLIRIEACGSNLCGYSVDAKTNQNGEKILINMRSIDDAKWTGRIHDPKSGSDYDSTIALQGPNSLQVQGCAFGGLFCGGQTWSRVN
jgi:uncharacterized protein (DUF2147 family)